MDTEFRCKASDDNCTGKHYGLGYCQFHWRRLKRGVELTAPKRNKLGNECEVGGCLTKPVARNLCGAHYQQRYRGVDISDVAKLRECPVPRCDRNSKSIVTDMCKVHYKLSWRYTLTRQQVIEMWTNAQCMNPGCGSRENLHIDHDHSCCGAYNQASRKPASCGKCVRGLLCKRCNTTLGLMQEDPRKIKGLLVYLKLSERVS